MDRESGVEWREDGSGRQAGREVSVAQQEILRLTGEAIPRVDFFNRLCRLLMRSSRSPAVEVWVDEGDAYLRARLSARDGFGFAKIPGLVGEVFSAEIVCELADIEPVGWEHGVLSGYRMNCPGSPGGQVEEDESVGARHAVWLLPLRVGEDTVGWLAAEPDGAEYETRREIAWFGRITETLGIAISSQRSQAALRERVKELMGLYRISHLAEQPGVSVDELLQGVADFLPPAWQYPEVAVARIELDGAVYRSGAEGEAFAQQRAPIVVDGEICGFVEVAYTAAQPQLNEGPFLIEERHLLDAIAREVAVIIERRRVAGESVRLREQLYQTDRLATVGKLAAGVAHELNEPLGAVLGFAQLGRKDPGVPPGLAEDLGKIEAAALYAREIVKKLMFFAHQTPRRTEEVDLNQVVADVLCFLEGRCAKQGIKVLRRLAPELPLIVADPWQLQQVLVNLVINAAQAMAFGGRLVITTKSQADWVVIEVEDTGIGMSEEVRGKVFLPFFTTKDVHEGTGLGLAVAHGIIEAHGGEVQVTSEEGRGSCFEIRLPIGDEANGE